MPCSCRRWRRDGPRRRHHAERHQGRYSPGASGPLPQAAEAADDPARIRQGGPRVRSGRHRSSRLPAPPVGVGTPRPRAPRRRAPHPCRPVPGSEELRHLRTAIPSLNKMLVLELGRCEFILRRENIIALGNSGTGKTHVALALGLAACQKGFTVAFTTAASLVNQLTEARDERRLLKLQRDLQAVKLLIVDELGYVPLSASGAELLFEAFSQRYERGSTIDIEPSFRGLDIGPRIGASHRRPARQAHPSRQHLDHERRQLPPQAIGRPPPDIGQGGEKPGHPRDRRQRHRRHHHQLIQTVQRHGKGPDRGPFHVAGLHSLACVYSAPLAWNQTGVDTSPHAIPMHADRL